MSLKQNLAVKILAGYVALSFVVMEILCRWNWHGAMSQAVFPANWLTDLGVWCRPFSQYWAVPPDNSMYNLDELTSIR
jgi:hypothetical protein